MKTMQNQSMDKRPLSYHGPSKTITRQLRVLRPFSGTDQDFGNNRIVNLAVGLGSYGAVMETV